MLKEATKNAKIAANEFAQVAGVQVGGIRTARQGNFSVRDIGNSYYDTQTIEKEARVVITITFFFGRIRHMLKSKFSRLLIGLIFLLSIGFMAPENKILPVLGATPNDWHKDTFWYEPWGASGVHKGIDIFADQNTPVLATTNMFIFYRGTLQRGGNVVIGLGPKWRIHYFAHLKEFTGADWVAVAGEPIGLIGATGNAKGKPPHLHYSILSLIPIPWLMDFSTQGYKKMFYLNPINYFNS